MDISHYFQTKRAIKQLQSNRSSNDTDINQSLLTKIMTGMHLSGTTVENKKIYRARTNDESKLFNNISDVIYRINNPNPGRFHLPGESVFYSSCCELGTIMEQNLQINKYFTISSFDLKTSESPWFIPIDMKERFNHYLKLNRLQQLLIDFVYSEAMKINDYSLSALIGSKLLTSITQDDVQIARTGIAYPGIQSKLLSRAPTYNLAMLPEQYHQHYIFCDATLYVLIPELNHLVLMPLNKGYFGLNNSINWEFSKDEMNRRVKAGLLCNDVIDNRITRLQPL